MTRLFYPPSLNATQKTLGAALLSGVTAAATLNNVTGIQNKAGVFVVDRVDTTGVETPSKREYIAFTGTSGSTVVTLTRNVDTSGTDQDHAIGAIVEFIPDVVWAQAISDALANLVDTTTLALDTTKVVDLTTAQTLTNKRLTSPKINENVAVTATATELNQLAGRTLPTTIVGTTDTQNLTNKRINKRVTTAASYTTDTGSSLNCDTMDIFEVTAQAGALKFNNPGGTPVDGQMLQLSVTGTGARALTYDTQFESSAGGILPTTTVTTARIDILVQWRSDTSKWHCLASV